MLFLVAFDESSITTCIKNWSNKHSLKKMIVNKSKHKQIHTYIIFLIFRLKRGPHLAMVVRQQEPIFVPVNWVVRIPNYTAVYKSVSPCNCRDVLHRPNPWWTWLSERKKGDRWKEREKVIRGRMKEGKRRSLVNGVTSKSWNFRNKKGGWQGGELGSG